MNPEELAARIIAPTGSVSNLDPRYRHRVETEIASAIRSAIADEKEACAKVVEKNAGGWMAGSRARTSIAAAIRSGGDKP